MRSDIAFVPEVSLPLVAQPPATFWQPSGLQGAEER